MSKSRGYSPRGKLWSPSTLIGSAERGSGILQNPIYIGHLVWNKNRMVKDPDTGRRVSRSNPPSEWEHASIPELRIISDHLFEAVRQQLTGRSINNGEIGSQRRPKRLLSGLLKCGACGSGMAVSGLDKTGRTRLRCSAHVNSGACTAPKTFYLDDV
ncbi:recombinase family protein [Shinella sp. CPCC 101442]|uniref:recombinase family protein n=1 Tax=Shinella sp. CPCC 101442 TaxID=2932265 RepID=UPI0035B50A37